MLTEKRLSGLNVISREDMFQSESGSTQEINFDINLRHHSFGGGKDPRRVGIVNDKKIKCESKVSISDHESPVKGRRSSIKIKKIQ